MRLSKRTLLIAATSLTIVTMVAAALVVFRPSGAHAASGITRTINSSGTTSPVAGAIGTASGVEDPEFAGEPEGDAEGGEADPGGDHGVDRSHSGATKGNGQAVNSEARAKSNPELSTHFEGLNFFNQRFANGGNQFSVEPPDQG